MLEGKQKPIPASGRFIVPFDRGGSMQRIDKAIADFAPSQPVITLPSETSVAQASDLMVEQHASCVLVEDNNKLSGIFTERDFLEKVAFPGIAPEEISLQEVMTPSPETLGPGDCITYAINKMAVGGFRNIPIVDIDERPSSILAIRDVVDHLRYVFEDTVEDNLSNPYAAEWIDLGGG